MDLSNYRNLINYHNHFKPLIFFIMSTKTQIIASSTGGSNYEPIQAGTYVARCYSMIHMGTVKESYMGEEKFVNKVRLTFELPTELKVFKEENGEQPQVISKEFTLSLGEKSNLRAFLNSWRGKALTEEECKAFDITVLAGKACTLSIIHKTSKVSGKTYAEIGSIGGVMKGMEVPALMNPQMVFSVSNFDQVAFDSFPDFIKEKIESSNEYKVRMQSPQLAVEEPIMEVEEDDLPW
jgi:hypothetical protein